MSDGDFSQTAKCCCLRSAALQSMTRTEVVGPLRIFTFLAMLVLIVRTSLAQDGGIHATQVVKSTSALVIVPTLVRTESGELIRNLDAEHFRLADNGEEQNVYLQRVENEPLAVVVLIQTGGAAASELGNYGKLDSIVRSILGTSPSKLDLISFDSHVRQIWAFPPRVDGVEYALTHQVVGDKGAAVRDAVRCGINILQNQPAQFRRIILLLSQAEDSGSQSRLAGVVRDVARSGTTIYSFTFFSSGTRTKSHKTKAQRRNIRDLPSSPDAAELAAESGGENVRFSGEDDLEQEMSIVREDIRSGYILSFRPSAPTPGLHKIRVEVVEQRDRLKVLARKNYWLD
jgi:VWFA-related protein